MSGDGISREVIASLLEAARWAPSSGNGQPWRAVVTYRGTTAFQNVLGTLDPTNQEWAHRAGALIVWLSKGLRDDGKPVANAAFDAGAAWMALALQASAMKLSLRPMGGFSAEALREQLHIPGAMTPHCVIAVGIAGGLELLSEKNREREAPNDRNPVSAWAFEADLETPFAMGQRSA